MVKSYGFGILNFEVYSLGFGIYGFGFMLRGLGFGLCQRASPTNSSRGKKNAD